MGCNGLHCDPHRWLQRQDGGNIKIVTLNGKVAIHNEENEESLNEDNDLIAENL